MKGKILLILFIMFLAKSLWGYKWIQTNFSGGTNSSITYIYTNTSHNKFNSFSPMNYTTFPVRYFYTNNGLEIRCKMSNSIAFYEHFDDTNVPYRGYSYDGREWDGTEYYTSQEYTNDNISGGYSLNVKNDRQYVLSYFSNGLTNYISRDTGTIELWVKPRNPFATEIQGHKFIKIKMANDRRVQIASTNGEIWYGGYIDWNLWHTPGYNASSLTTVQWSHFAIVWDLNNATNRLYLNGQQILGNKPSTTDVMDRCELVIGGDGGWGTTMPFDGLIDEVVVYNYVKQPNEFSTNTFKAYALSVPINMKGTGVVYSNIYWVEDIGSTHGGGNPFKFQIRTAPDNSGSPDWGNGTKFIGPDGTTNTYYTNSGQPISSSNNNKQWLQYKIYYESSAPYFSKALKKVSITFEPPDTTPPVSPSITNIISENSRLIIQWSPVTNSDLAGYYLYKGTNTGVYYVTNILSIRTLFTDTGLINYQTNYYRISAFDTSSNESILSAEAKSAPHPDTSAPDTPANFTATGGSSQITLTWSASLSNDVMGYIIYKGTNTGIYYSTNYTGKVTNYIDSPVSNEVAYYYRVAAYDEETNISSLSAETVATAHLDPFPPDSPQNLVAVGGMSNVSLHWTLSQSNDVIGYSLAKGTNTGVYYTTNFLSTASLTTMANTAYYTDRNVIIDKTYYYIVMAKDDGGNLSPPSNETNATPFLDNTAPDIPQNFTGESYNSKVFLTWSASLSNDTAGYKIYRGTSTGVYSTIINVGNTTKYTDSNIVNDTTYYYVVTSYDNYNNESKKTNEINITASDLIRKDRNNVISYNKEDGKVEVVISSNSLFTNGYLKLTKDNKYNNESLIYNIEGKNYILDGYNYYLQAVNSSSNFHLKGGETAVLKLYYVDNNENDNIVTVNNEEYYEDSLRIYKYSESAKLWLLISSSTVDKENNIVYADIDDINAYYTLSGEKVFSTKINENSILGGGPNPFRIGNNNFTIYLTYKDNISDIEIEILNIKGEVIRTFSNSDINNDIEKDYYSIDWDGKDKFENFVETGIYFYILKVNGKYIDTTRKKLVVIR